MKNGQITLQESFDGSDNECHYLMTTFYKNKQLKTRTEFSIVTGNRTIETSYYESGYLKKHVTYDAEENIVTEQSWEDGELLELPEPD